MILRNALILLVIICVQLDLRSQNVGIGTASPQVKLHIYDTADTDVSMIIHSADSTTTLALDGWGANAKRILFRNLGVNKSSINYESGTLRFYTNLQDVTPVPALTLVGGRVGINVGSAGVLSQRFVVNGKMKIGDDGNAPESGALRYNSIDSIFQFYDGLNWRSSSSPWLSNTNNLFYNDKPVLIGRSHTIGSEKFGVRMEVSGANFGGMYMETFGDPNSKPFYGYAIDNAFKAWHYFDGGTSTWKLYNSGDRLAVRNNGNVGIGVSSPDNRLDIKSTGIAGSADIVLGLISDASDRPTLQFSEWATATPGSGMSIEYDGAAGDGDNNLLHIRGVDQIRKFTFSSGGKMGIGTTSPDEELHVFTSSGNAGIKIESDAGNAILRLDASAGATGFSQLRFTENGGLSGGIFYNYSSDAMAFYEGGYAMYLKDSRVGIGTLPNVNYRLSVDGKIIAEELKVQLSQNWPDYVFGKEYQLMSLEDVAEFIGKNKHLPGVPSAEEVSTENGIELGEMNRILLEKIEELTLHLIRQQREIDNLKLKIK